MSKDTQRALSLKMSEEMREYLRKQAYLHDTSIGAVIRMIIEDKIDKEKVNEQKEEV